MSILQSFIGLVDSW